MFKCLSGHKFTEIKGIIMCEKCGKYRDIVVEKKIFNKSKKAQIIYKKDIIEELLEK